MNSMNVLLIDDDVFMRDMYGVKFSQSGHTITTAENAIEGLRKLSDKNVTYDVVLVDMIMPAMNGVEFLDRLAAEHPSYKNKCVVLTNQGQDAEIQSAMDAGALAYIIKAEHIPSEVVSKVEALMSNN